MTRTYGSLFTGFGGACLGARAAGLELAWGNELDPAIAEVGNCNLGGHIRVGNVLEQNPHDYERVDVMHMSPPCTRASVANGSAEVNEDGLKESPLDIALANKCIEFIETLQPECVTLENVWGYRVFQSWKGGRKCEGIQSALYRLGYWVSVEHVNSADFGVAQTRRRMIVRAIRGGWVPYLPQPVPWMSWYSAIEDILHTLPDSQFAPWQLARLPEELRTMLVAQGKYGDNLVMAQQDKPAFTITANSNQTGVRALLVSNAKTEYSDGTRQGDDPAFTVTGESNGRVKAFLMGKNQDKFGDGMRYAVEPAQTIGANEHGSKAFIVDCKNTGRDATTARESHEPMFTVMTDGRHSHAPRAFDGGRVVAMTPRALARFQSFPDWYQLPDSKTLAAKGIGNAVCPLGYQRIVEGLCNL
jgi:DNA (cytosine-5)-methyltransferase 1